ncbi:MAG: hypothetical protein ACREDV_02245 [Methylocella sp.]
MDHFILPGGAFAFRNRPMGFACSNPRRIRDKITELLRAPLDEDAIVAKLSEAYPNLKDQADEEYPDMWLALAGQFHTHGVMAATAFATANAIIDTASTSKPSAHAAWLNAT